MSTEQGIDSESSTSAVSPGLSMSPEERRARQGETEARRLSWVKTHRPERTLKLLEGVPPKYRGRALKVIAGEAGMAERVKFNCEQCVGWEEVQARVGDCRSFACAFWLVRPHQEKEQVT